MQTTSYEQLSLRIKNNYHLTLCKGWSDGESSRQWNEIWLVLDGGAYLKVGDREYRVRKGDLVMLPDVLPKFQKCDEEEHFELYVIDFLGSFLGNSVFEYLFCSDWVVHLDDESFNHLREVFARSLCDHASVLPFCKLLQADRDMLTVVSAFFERADIVAVPQKGWLEETLRYIAAHLHEKLTVEVLAKRVALHPTYFARCFRERLGTTPAKYIADIRTERIEKHLREGLPPREISELIGFSSTQQFFRFFKQQTGMTPGEYIKRFCRK